jgi:hypothetical protein
MTTTDPTTFAITGQLPFILLLATLLAFPLSFLLLGLYRRNVLKGMNRPSNSPPATRESTDDGKPPQLATNAARRPVIVETAAGKQPGQADGTLYRRAISSPRRAGLVYGAGGLAFSAVLAFSFLVSSTIEILPMRFLMLLCAYAWPLVLTLLLVTAAQWRTKLLLIGTYGCSYALIATTGLFRSPDSSISQLMILWLVTNLPPTLVILLFLIRRVRAIGPLVVTFMVLALTGATLLVSFLNQNQNLLQAVANVGFSLGLGGTSVFWSLNLLGFALFVPLGLCALQWLRLQYRHKRANDRSLVLDALWFLSGISYAISLVFEGPAWILAGPVAFVAYKVVVLGGFRIVEKAGTSERPVRLLLLRVFSLGKRSEALFDAITRHWRYIGHIQLISGPDLATSTMDPDEFFDIMGGRLGDHFISGPESLTSRVNEMDIRPDFDGRYRVNEFFCHDNTWQMTLSRLVEESDAVLMDLRGFSPKNAGCTYEVRELVSCVPLDRVVMTIDGTTDRPFLEQTLNEAWAGMRPGSPNHLATGELRVVRLDAGDAGPLKLLQLMCAAAETSQTKLTAVAAT